ncbi:MAG: ATP-binding protein [Pseudomonadaceae bacterium]|nr:ATP-binding protein [Pseudomonadaceae bacterium]
MIYLIEGPVGAGKSTYARQLSQQHNALHLNLDEWMVVLFRPDRPEVDFMHWYNERKQRCIEQIWATALNCSAVGITAVLELGLVQQADRIDVYNRAEDAGLDLQVVVLGAPRKERMARVQKRNLEQGDTFQMLVSDEIFALADAAWQAPDDKEFRLRSITMIDTA